MSNQQLSVIERPEQVAKFIKLFSGVHRVDEERATQMFEVEKYNFLRSLHEMNLPAEVSQISVGGTFLDVVRDGLSFGAGAKHVYLLTRSVKTANGYEKRLYYSLTPDGNIYLAQKSRAIQYLTKPVIVYDGDEFAPYTNDKGNQVIMHKPLIPRKKDARIIAGYIFVIFPSGVREPFWMLEDDWKRLQGYSARQNRNEGGNALYTAGPGGQIDAGFLGAKLIKHALKNVRKSGSISSHQVDDVDEADYSEVPSPAIGPKVPDFDFSEPKQPQLDKPKKDIYNGERDFDPQAQEPQQDFFNANEPF